MEACDLLHDGYVLRNHTLTESNTNTVINATWCVLAREAYIVMHSRIWLFVDISIVPK